VLINRNFTRLWFGQAVSVVGDFVFDTTMLLWVAIVLLPDKSYAPMVSSGMLLVVALAAVAVAPVAGVLVDRWDKRLTMLRADLIRFVLVGFLAVLSALPAGVVPIPVLLVITAVVVTLATAAAGFFNPARIVLIGDIVPEEHLGKASGYVQVTGAAAAIVGPPLAAPLLVGVGVEWALAVNAVSFLVSYLFVRSVRPDTPAADVGPTVDAPAPDGGGFRREFVAGLALFRSNGVLATLLVSSTLVMLGAGAVNALDVYFLQENLHADPEWFGLLGAAFGLGAVVGAALGGIAGDRFGHATVFRASLLGAALLFVVYSQLGALVPGIVVVALFSVGLGCVGTVVMPLIVKSVPREFLGRVVSVIGPVNQVATVVSIAGAGALVGVLPTSFHTTVLGVEFGRIDLVFTVSAVLMLGGACYALVRLRGADDPPAPAEPAVAIPTPVGGDDRRSDT
jgi:MFS family permease